MKGPIGEKSESRACHRAVKVIKYLYRKLGRENVISKRPKRLLNSTDLEWSPYSPDLNGSFQIVLKFKKDTYWLYSVLDFYFWSVIKTYIRSRAPKTVEELQQVVDDYFRDHYNHSELVKTVEF